MQNKTLAADVSQWVDYMQKDKNRRRKFPLKSTIIIYNAKNSTEKIAIE